MIYDFNVDEVFEMAEQVERNGAKFYREAAENVDDSDAKKLLNDFAIMEDQHEKTFAALRSELKDVEKQGTVFDPDEESILYLRALADTRVFFKKEIDTSSLKEILKAALIAEKDSIVFYLGMKELVPEKLGKDKIDSIIKEEMNHIKIIGGKLREFKK
ncbi:MAG: ferritin family protein [Deltaproteobacteria bacterium]|nr:ferritin family protein [Deltaproteobacteria bacterium]MBW2218171.1 ferritin family protein [Deltaproteobacteria bacterium]